MLELKTDEQLLKYKKLSILGIAVSSLSKKWLFTLVSPKCFEISGAIDPINNL